MLDKSRLARGDMDYPGEWRIVDNLRVNNGGTARNLMMPSNQQRVI